MEQTKITFRAWTPQMLDFDKKLRACHIKRDAFLNDVLRDEVRYLARDMKGRKLSPAAKRYITDELTRLKDGLDIVNIVVDKDVAQALNEVVKGSKMVRDAFFNRLILFLRSPDELLNYLDLPSTHFTPSDYNNFFEAMPISPLKAIDEAVRNPLATLRAAVEQEHEEGLYSVDLPPPLVGLSCYLDDAFVPGTKAYKANQENLDKLLEELNGFESEAFKKQKEQEKQP